MRAAGSQDGQVIKDSFIKPPSRASNQQAGLHCMLPGHPITASGNCRSNKGVFFEKFSYQCGGRTRSLHLLLWDWRQTRKPPAFRCICIFTKPMCWYFPSRLNVFAVYPFICTADSLRLQGAAGSSDMIGPDYPLIQKPIGLQNRTSGPSSRCFQPYLAGTAEGKL